MKQSKIALINDLSGFGRCSLTVAMPVLSVMGHQCCPLPTALLSNHTGYESYTFTDCTAQMRPIMKEWQKLRLSFGGIYTGFLGSAEQIDISVDFLKTFGEKALKVVDPVMGDHGKPYTTYTLKMQKEMARLVRYADVLTPNLTELCILLGEPYPTAQLSPAVVQQMVAALTEQAGRYTVLTGLTHHSCAGIPRDEVVNLGFDKKTGQFVRVAEKRIPRAYAGTGDLFSSVLCGKMVQGVPFERAVSAAADFVCEAAELTFRQNGGEQDGMIFEPILFRLGEIL